MSIARTLVVSGTNRAPYVDGDESVVARANGSSTPQELSCADLSPITPLAGARRWRVTPRA